MTGPRFALEPDSPGECVEIWHPDALPGTEVLLARNCRRRWRILHDTYAICHVPIAGNEAAGYSRWWYRGVEHDCTAGGTIVVEPGEVHATRRLHRPAVFYWALKIPPPLMQAAGAEDGLGSLPHLRIAQSQSERLYAASERLFRAMAEDRSPLEQETRLTACVRTLLDECGERRPSLPERPPIAAIRRARDYLHAHYAEPVRLEELAGAAGVSRFHLAHLFTRAIGLPPHAYQTHIRVTAAQRLLRSGAQPAHVDVGFSDQSHLGRHFKRIVGVTPGEYAAIIGGRRRFDPPSVRYRSQERSI
jgi:AraC-like DNA-binding protein